MEWIRLWSTGSLILAPRHYFTSCLEIEVHYGNSSTTSVRHNVSTAHSCQSCHRVLNSLYAGIKQSAWVRSGNDVLRRDFEYQIDRVNLFGRYHALRLHIISLTPTSGRARATDVMDYQMIDSQKEHLCYVVTDRKTPWALPYAKHLSLLTKIVITHCAKSKCRLTIYTRVDWQSSVRLFQGKQ